MFNIISTKKIHGFLKKTTATKEGVVKMTIKKSFLNNHNNIKQKVSQQFIYMKTASLIQYVKFSFH